MNIKEILIEMKNRTSIDKFEGNHCFGIKIRDLYSEKISLKYFNTTGKKKIDDFIKNDKDKIKKINKKTKISYKISMFLVYILLIAFLISNINVSNSAKLLIGFFASTLTVCLFSFIFELFNRIKKKIINSIIKKVDKETTKYVEDNFKDFYKDITLDFIKEIELINDITLEKEKNELKEYLIAKLYYYEHNDIDAKDKLKKLVNDKLFNDNKNYLENKILKDERNSKEHVMINTEDEIAKLKISIKNKIPTI